MDSIDPRVLMDTVARVKAGQARPGDADYLRAVLVSGALPQGSETGARIQEALAAGGGGTDWAREAATVPSALTPSTAPSVADQVNAAQGGHGSPVDAVGGLLSGAGATIDSMPDPVGAVLTNLPGLSATGRAIVSGQEIPATTGPGDDLAADPLPSATGPRIDPATRTITPPQDWTGSLDPAESTLSGANPLPDRGGGHDRARERGGRGGGTDWRNEAASLGGRLPGESAFAGIEAGMLPTLEANPALAANFIARQRGAGDAGGALIAPQLEQLMNLNRAGLLGGKGVGPSGGLQGSANRLGSAEALYNAMGPGSYLDPQSLHRETLRNIRRTDAATMSSGTGEGEAGDINNQIAVTNDALLVAASASMAPDALAAMEARLAGAEQEYIMGVVDGSIVPGQMSYPQWLRTEKKVRKWVGPGTTPEQWQQAFSTE